MCCTFVLSIFRQISFLKTFPHLNLYQHNNDRSLMYGYGYSFNIQTFRIVWSYTCMYLTDTFPNISLVNHCINFVIIALHYMYMSNTKGDSGYVIFEQLRVAFQPEHPISMSALVLFIFKVIHFYSDVSLSLHISFCSNLLLPVISGRVARRHVFSRHNAHLFFLS